MLGNRRAVSEIIAGLILLLIVSILGILLYNFTLNTAGYQSETVIEEYSESSKKIQERFKIISVWDDSGSVNITVFNYGEMPVYISDVYFNGTRINTEIITGIEEEIKTSDIKSIWFPESITPGEFYIVKVVSNRGVSSQYDWEP